MASTVLSVRVSRSLKEELKQKAKERGTTLSDFVCTILQMCLDGKLKDDFEAK